VCGCFSTVNRLSRGIIETPISAYLSSYHQQLPNVESCDCPRASTDSGSQGTARVRLCLLLSSSPPVLGPEHALGDSRSGEHKAEEGAHSSSRCACLCMARAVLTLYPHTRPRLPHPAAWAGSLRARVAPAALPGRLARARGGGGGRGLDGAVAGGALGPVLVDGLTALRPRRVSCARGRCWALGPRLAGGPRAPWAGHVCEGRGMCAYVRARV
jgi:hypothetical protein